MSDTTFLLLSVLTGGMAGAFFFGGLWYTVLQLSSVKRPKLFLLQSFLFRASVVLLLLYFTVGEDLIRLSGYAIGFLGMRSIIIRRFVA